LACLSSIFFLGCGSAPETVASSPQDKPATSNLGPSPDQLAAGDRPTSPWPAPFRLDQIVRPLRYDLALRLNPSEPTYSGTVTIPVSASKPVWVVHMHASGLTVSAARALTQGRAVPLDVAIKDDNLALSVPASEPHPLPTGNFVLELTFAGPQSDAPLGAYRTQEEGRWYAFTQFEPLEARQAFPCFDEPGIKVPFGLDLTVPDPMVAVANSPEEARVAASEAGYTKFSFIDTPPLPTYLVAWAVGDFDIVDYGAVSNGQVPFRIVTAKGKGAMSKFAGRVAPKHLAALEAWFGTPYPFPKLDFVALPSFGSSGMENAGLITFREALLLMDGEHASAEDRLWSEGVISHELAHMWFGDLVTLAWWDDIWLNEAFATFMSRKALQAVSPELGVDLLMSRSRYGVMHGDERPAARAIRQPITQSGDIYNAFDGITYSKGAAVLRMIEAWMGADVFQKGVRAYLAERAHGSATTADLVKNLSDASGLPVATVMAAFTDRAGVPVVDVRWSCPPQVAGAATQAVAISVSQHAYRGPGDERPSVGSDAPPWAVPVCLAFGGGVGQREGRVCGLLQRQQESWAQELPYCPTWINPDADAAGYYRWTSEPQALPNAAVSAVDQYALLENLKVDMDAGRTPLTRWLDEIQLVAQTKDLPQELLEQVLSGPAFIVRVWPEARNDAHFKAYVKRLLAQQTVALDLGGASATMTQKQSAPLVVRALGGWVEDPKVLAEAKRVSESFLGDLEKNTDKTRLDLAQVYLPMHVAKSGADEKLWARLRADFDKVRNPNERDLMIEALGAFDDPGLVVKSQGLFLDGTLRAQDLRTLRADGSGRREIVLAVWSWLTANFDAVVAKIGEKSAPGLPGFGGAFCTTEDDQRLASFFASKQASLPNGLEHNVKTVREGIGQCIASTAKFGAAAKSWVQAQN